MPVDKIVVEIMDWVSLQLDDEAVVVSECVLDVSIAWSMVKVGLLEKNLIIN
jgi:hypothetical protein